MNQNRYKCTHNYPGGPDVGYISKPHKVQPETDENCHYYNHNWFDPKLYPEFWERIEEKQLKYGVTSGFLPWNSYNPDHYTDISKVKFFDTEAEQQVYIEENKPQYSKKDMIEFGRSCFNAGRYYSSADSISAMLDKYVKK